MKRIPLKHGEFALVDDDDFDKVSKYKWHRSKQGYAVSASSKVYMHRLVNATPKGFHTDHINHEKLDNRKENLRTATSSQNAFNTGLWSHNTSGHKGVYWYERYKKWEVYINVNGKRIYLKRFKSLQDALNARRNAEVKYCEPFK